MQPLRDQDALGWHYLDITGGRHYFDPSDPVARRRAYVAARAADTTPKRALVTYLEGTSMDGRTALAASPSDDDRPVEERWAEMRQKYGTGKSVFS